MIDFYYQPLQYDFVFGCMLGFYIILGLMNCVFYAFKGHE